MVTSPFSPVGLQATGGRGRDTCGSRRWERVHTSDGHGAASDCRRQENPVVSLLGPTAARRRSIVRRSLGQCWTRCSLLDPELMGGPPFSTVADAHAGHDRGMKMARLAPRLAGGRRLFSDQAGGLWEPNRAHDEPAQPGTRVALRHRVVRRWPQAINDRRRPNRLARRRSRSRPGTQSSSAANRPSAHPATPRPPRRPAPRGRSSR